MYWYVCMYDTPRDTLHHITSDLFDITLAYRFNLVCINN